MDFRAFALAALVLAAGAAPAQPAFPPPYLSPAEAPDTLAILPPAPTPDSPRGMADRAIFRATRVLKDTPRWALAQNDNSEAVPATLKDFSCAAGANLTEANSPKLAALLRRVRSDVVVAVNKPKDHYRRQRPFLLDPGDICIDRTASLAASADYPSGHTSWGWTVGLILAEIDPSHAGTILTRARSYGESRVVCGVHNASAIDAGRTNGAVVVAALHGDAGFRADLEATRAEVAPLVAAGGTDAGACATEAALIAKSPW